jgi:hypothetical protein
MKKLVYILLVLLCQACVRDAKDIELPKAENKLVLNSFISPEDSFIVVKLGLNAPIFGSNVQGTPDWSEATVKLSEQGGASADLNYNFAEEAFIIHQAVFPIKPGKTYTVEATYKQFKVSASCTVPLQLIELSNAKIVQLRDPLTSSSGGPIYRISYSFNDIPGQKNYYRIITQSWATGGFRQSPEYWEICNSLFTDENKDGSSFSGTCEDFSWSSSGMDTNTNARYIFVMNCDKDYYEFISRRLNYFGEDPFSEPFQMHSNVKNGLGIFASYRNKIVKVALP